MILVVILNNSNSDYYLISVKNKKEWIAALSLCGLYDIYHSPDYHLLAEYQKEGEAFLFFMRCAEGYAALPFLIRRVSEINGLEDYSYLDATSVYGYPGIVSSVKKNDDGSSLFRIKFQKGLLKVLSEMGVVSFFSRLNPLFSTSWMFESIGDIIQLGNTVAVDLLQPENLQIKGMSKGHRYDIRKMRSEGVVVKEDKNFEYLDDFIKIYNETMNNSGAIDYYYFPKEYYLKCKELLGDSIKLFIAQKDHLTISASMFLLKNEIIQYHLSGTPRKYLIYGGAKAILDAVRQYGAQHGYKWLHLGGGVGSKEDTLFRFKAGFSKIRFQFEIVKAIINPKLYTQLVNQKNIWAESNNFQKQFEGYFPYYRTPVIDKMEK